MLVSNRSNIVLAFLLGIVPVLTVTGFIPDIRNIYYICLAIVSLCAIFKVQNIERVGFIILLACILSIIFGDPDPLFNSWTRLGLFTLVFIASFPLFQSCRLIIIRDLALKWSLITCSLLSVGSFICFFIGLNYMSINRGVIANDYITHVGLFSGLFNHSMNLGPVAGISTIFLFWNASYVTKKKWRIFLYLCAFMTFCASLMSASRGAVAGVIIALLTMVYFAHRHRIKKLLSATIKIVILLVLLLPIYSPFMDRVMKKQEINVENGGLFASRESRWTHRVEEFQDNPIFGCGFSAIYTTIDRTGEYRSETGSCEPGSSWLAVLSMTGLFGFIGVISAFIKGVKNSIRLHSVLLEGNLYLGLLTFFFVHLFTEGYIFAGGNYLCLLFWLICGCAFSSAMAWSSPKVKAYFCSERLLSCSLNLHNRSR